MPTRPQSQQHFCMIAHPCTPFAKLFMIQWSQSRHWGGRGPWDYSLVVTWWEDSRQLASITYFTSFAKNASSTLSARFLFLSPQMIQTKRKKEGLKREGWTGMFGGIRGHESFRLRVAYFSPTRCLRGGAPLFSDFGHANLQAWDSAEKGREQFH